MGCCRLWFGDVWWMDCGASWVGFWLVIWVGRWWVGECGCLILVIVFWFGCLARFFGASFVRFVGDMIAMIGCGCVVVL